MRPSLIALALVVAPVSLLPSQADLLKQEAELTNSATKTLLQFARSAESRRVGPRARQAYDLVLEYDHNNAVARRALGYRKVKGEWLLGPKDELPMWKDDADDGRRFRVTDDWVHA